MAQKETKMVIKVDLACEKCRKKIKKVLCDIPQVQDQVYNEKENTVTITVVHGNPDEVKKKICCKGGKTVKCIEIVPPPKPKPPPPKPPPPPPPKCCRECCKGVCVGPCWACCGRPGPCCYGGCNKGSYPCRECCKGVSVCPCLACCGRPGPCCYGGCNKGYCPCECTVYICEENPAVCTIM